MARRFQAFRPWLINDRNATTVGFRQYACSNILSALGVNQPHKTLTFPTPFPSISLTLALWQGASDFGGGCTHSCLHTHPEIPGWQKRNDREIPLRKYNPGALLCVVTLKGGSRRLFPAFCL
ncbi:hypothetical protein CEXT_687811 [Caerostris extrusa]|uniref:Uncharacterized protein n=1 Tax=Caerostris extrusa TaxID=172846 RepID=A0AAV4QQH1_CAEEX|nr:hypothetical protein CEXT_687811 [Caerostris extrusa]